MKDKDKLKTFDLKLREVPNENYDVDLTIARGLDYYTGTVYETFLDKYITSLYFMVTTMTTVGYGDIICISHIETPTIAYGQGGRLREYHARL